MAGRDDERMPGFNAPLADAGPIVSKRTGRRRARVHEAFGAPQKMIPLGRLRHQRAAATDTSVVDIDDTDVGPGRGSTRGIVITLLILIVLGTRGCGLLDNGDSDEPSVPTPTTGRPSLVQRLPASGSSD